jgi:NitT/TauT family transport system substrate-binding protein
MRMSFSRVAAAAMALFVSDAAQAADKLRFANGGFGLWAVEGPRVGQQGGIFAKYGLEIDAYGTAGAGETIQAVISGSADMSVGVGTTGVLGAYAKGAPIRIFGNNFVGASDLFYYVRADSPLARLTDATAAHTIGYSTAGSSSNMTVLALLDELGIKAKATATGDQPATLTQVMSGQIDIGFSTPPFGLKELEEGKIRMIGNGNDAPSLRQQSVRVDIVGLRLLKERPDVFQRFTRAYRETLDWMYRDPEAIRLWAASTGVPVERARRAAFEFQPRAARDPEQVVGLDALMASAVRQKFLSKPLTPEQLADLIQIPKP